MNSGNIRYSVAHTGKWVAAVLVLWAIIELYAKLFTWYKISCS